MPVDAKLLEILCCPVSRVPLTRLQAAKLERLNAYIAEQAVKRVDGAAVAERLDEALVTEDGKVIYPVREGIPVLLAEEGIGTTQFKEF